MTISTIVGTWLVVVALYVVLHNAWRLLMSWVLERLIRERDRLERELDEYRRQP